MRGVELATIGSAAPRRDRRVTATLPARLRSALANRGWTRTPEPRVRFGQPILPGVATIGPAMRHCAGAFLGRAEALRDGVLVHLGRSVRTDGRLDWSPRGTSSAWQAALHGLDELLAVAVAGATAPSPEERRGWYEVASSVFQDWKARVPGGHGVAWGVPALARRVRNLLLLQGLFAAELKREAALRGDLLRTTWAHAEALALAAPGREHDAWSIAAANALLLAGRFFDGMEARGWVETGTALLWGQLREQILEDGGHVTRSPVWQAFVLAEFVTTLAVLRADNDDVPVWGRKRVKGMADCFARLTHPDGSLAAFDPVEVDDAWPAHELLAAAAVVLHDPAYAIAPAFDGVWPLLVLGESGRRAYGGLGRSQLPGVSARALRRSSFFVLGDGADSMVVDGAVRRFADGPAAFGYELAIGGAPFVVGVPVGAETPGPIAEHARSARAHNVVAVAGAEGACEESLVEARLTIRDGVQYFLGACHGFGGAGPDVQYRRRIFCLPGRFWLVCEELSGSGTFAGESFVHFHPDVAVRARCTGRPVLELSRGDATVRLLVAGARTVGLAGGVTSPNPQGWHPSPGGGWTPMPVGVVRVAGTLPVAVGYALVPGTSDEDAEVSLRADPFELRATIRLGAVAYDLTAVQDEVELVTRDV